MPNLCTTNGPYEVNGDEVRQKEQVLDGEMRLPSIRICKVGGYSDGYRASEIAELLNKGSHFEALCEELEQALEYAAQMKTRFPNCAAKMDIKTDSWKASLARTSARGKTNA